MQIKTERIISIVDPKLATRLFEFKLRQAALNAGYKTVKEWHEGVAEDWGEFPRVEFKMSEVYHGTRERFAYNHHHAVCRYGDRYIVSWSTARIHEDRPGQEVHFSVSDDLSAWAPDQTLVSTDPSSGLIRNNAGLCVQDGKLYDIVGVVKGGQMAQDPSLTSFVPEALTLDVYVTEDLTNWQEYPNIANDIYLFEGPRMLQDGSFLCCGSSFENGQPVALIWKKGRKLHEPPERRIIPVSDTRIKGVQGTWYQRDDGKIWMYIRDAGMSARLALSWSEDGGENWTDAILTDMPNTCSRAHAGRMSDGRYYIIGNNYENLLDRRYLMVAVSDDGENFDWMYTLVQGKTHRRIDGLHKEDGWHYPNSIVDGDELIVVFSVNKEDIYCGVTDVTKWS